MKNVVIGFLGSAKDSMGKGKKRWQLWRPSVACVMQPELAVDRFVLLHDARDSRLANNVGADMTSVSASTEVQLHQVSLPDPWDFAQVYAVLLDFAEHYPFNPEEERYFLHITTGTHVTQICWFLLCEANYIPAVLMQTAPDREGGNPAGTVQLIDLDLSKYDVLGSRFRRQHLEGADFLKSGIDTRNAQFNAMIQQIERVAIRSVAPILITGPTGAGKSQLAKRIYQLKQRRGSVRGEFVAINCATLRGDSAMSALFGHQRGAFTGAQQARKGLLARADRGLLFLDEIGELGLDEQAMLLHAIEEKSFYPVGADHPVQSDFQLIAGTNRDLQLEVEAGRFREDLLARINLWSYELPGLRHRREDIAPNLEYELQQATELLGCKVGFNRAAREQYLQFAQHGDALWLGNFRDLNASVQRMATLAEGGRINEDIVAEEKQRLQRGWRRQPQEDLPALDEVLDAEQLASIDLFDEYQLRKVVAVCRDSASQSEAGRRLFNRSRERKSSNNDAHRLRQYLARFGLTFDDLNK
ncbi:RNA repair transcriptional activator RtcR [Pokkaliibacter sp. MBI-7]|uniref:RNA repair transcriptional activator RtcR n=1 Tax=Pokkaliibacter sp. MBI-7 TaxID=3040600 RepID=UPI0024476D5D|nr:RNA repair transcriptional activator RtcR [Pokkaliibacter sp. MBI-7]MDH2431433.1 RNA repair transcriptional activator RtcR [Pokkaliibacter sp. MBI-7]